MSAEFLKDYLPIILFIFIALGLSTAFILINFILFQTSWSRKTFSLWVWIWTFSRFKNGVWCKVLFGCNFIYYIWSWNSIFISLGNFFRKNWNFRFHLYDDFLIHTYCWFYLRMEKRCSRLGVKKIKWKIS